jgi:hypothetical protein
MQTHQPPGSTEAARQLAADAGLEVDLRAGAIGLA